MVVELDGQSLSIRTGDDEGEEVKVKGMGMKSVDSAMILKYG